jgi:glycogen debranching enzyme
MTMPRQTDKHDRPTRGGPRSTDPAHRDRRKEQVLTQHTASVVRSISDAVVAKDGEPFFLCPPDGQVDCSSGHGYGLYHHDCRFLDGYELTIAGARPNALVATETEGSGMLIELTNPEIRLSDEQVLRKDQLGITWRRSIVGATPALEDAIGLRNYERHPVTVPLELRFAAGFDDVFAIRGLFTERSGDLLEASWESETLLFGYRGADGIDRALRIGFEPNPTRRRGDGVGFEVHLAERESATVRVTAEIIEQATPGATPIEPRDAPSEATRARRPWARTRHPAVPTDETWPTSVRTSSLALDAAVARSLDDLRTLRATLDGLRYYEAGIPWFATLFGRDALITALQTLAFDAEPAADTCRLLAARQGRALDEWRDEAPGKILHELRIGELARLNEIPHTPYYGTVDATPLFLILVAQHATWTGRLDLFEELRGPIDRALSWIDEFADTDDDGFVDYQSHTTRGLVNQGWKDSGDGIVDAEGRIARPPIALVEVQAYVYRAWLEIAGLFERAGDAPRADRLRRRAADLRDRFERAFWSDRLGCYVLALSTHGPCEVLASNAGHVLWGGIADADRAGRVAERLLSREMFNGWGIRTLSADAAGYHPVGYHLGTVWPHDNAIIAAGFRRYGLDDAADRIFVATVEATQHFPGARLPECFAGYDRAEYGVPVRYPVACHPQAWAAGTVPSMLISSLGLVPDAFERRLSIIRPRLPAFVPLAEIAGLPVGDARAHLRFERGAERTRVEVVAVDGDLHVDVIDR